MNQQQNSQTDSFRPPLLTACYIGLLGWLTYTLYAWGQNGFGWGIFLSFLPAVLFIRQIIRFFDDVAKLRAYRARQRAFKEAAADQGTSEFGSPEDARKAGLLGGGGR